MFFRDKAIHPPKDNAPSLSIFIDQTFGNFIKDSDLCAGFLCVWDDIETDIQPIASYSIPIAPFKGSKKEILKSYIINCLELHPKPHLHAIYDSELWREITSVTDVSNWNKKAIFIPAYIGEMEFICICFSEKKIQNISQKIISNLYEVIHVSENILSSSELKDKLNTMEIYVREIGHDIASSVQTIIAKLKNISRGYIEGPLIIDTIHEIEEEIMATYRIADTLGMTVDPDYNVGNGKDFDPCKLINDVLTLCKSEASERYIEFRFDEPEHTVNLWGDYKAIQSALMQLLINAIKYAKGSSYVTIRLVESYDNVEFSVTNVGMSLSNEEAIYVWDFGWRGDKAKEFHVNGSGIGLFTVKKIVKAHGGAVSLKISGQHNEVITFIFRIPKKHILDKILISVKTYS